MSHIRTIYNAVAALDLGTLDGAAITVYHLDTLRDSMESANLPARVLSPYGQTQASGALSQFTTLAGNSQCQWTITDLLLVQASEAGTGIGDVAPLLVDYAATYSDRLGTLRTHQWRLSAWNAAMGVINWPVGSDRFYDGVAVTLTFSEV